MRVTGHSLEELDSLRAEFDVFIERSLFLASQHATLSVDGTMTASALDAELSVVAEWNRQVDGVLLGHVAATYDGASLSVLHQIVDHSPLDPGEGLPLVSDDFATEYLTQARNRLKGIGNDVWVNVRSELLKGQQAGESVEELAIRVHGAAEVSLPRARTIARTEINGASNAGTHAQVMFLGMTGTQEWVSTHDGRCRQSHRLADGQKVPLGESFTVGGAALKYPGDSSGPASEIINCRCTQTYELDDDPPKVTCSGFVAAVVQTTYCAVPPPAASSLAPNYVKLGKLTSAQHAEIFQIFQSPKAISPAYGGAKIHKVLGDAMTKLQESGIPAYADLSPADVLAVVDGQYKGGKYTFKEKYVEWLAKKNSSGTTSPATPPVTNIPQQHAADVVDAPATSTTTPTPSAPPPQVSPTPTTVPTPSVQVPASSFDIHNPPQTTTGHIPLQYQSGDITDIPQHEKDLLYAEFKTHKVTAIWSGNKIWEAMQKTRDALKAKGIFINEHEALVVLDEMYGKNGGSTGFVDKIKKWESSPQGKKVLGEVTSTPTPSPTPVSVQAVTTPSAPAPTPTPAPPAVITSIKTYTDAEEYAKNFANDTPFATAVGLNGTKFRIVKNSNGTVTVEFYGNMQQKWIGISHSETKKYVADNDWTLLSQSGAPLQTPSVTAPPPPPTPAPKSIVFDTYAQAKKISADYPVDTPFATASTPVGGKLRLVKTAKGDVVYEFNAPNSSEWVRATPAFSKTIIPNYKWKTIVDGDGATSVPTSTPVSAPAPTPTPTPTPTVLPGPTATAPFVTPSVPQSIKAQMLNKLNMAGPLLSGPSKNAYAYVLEIKKFAKFHGHTLSDLDVLRILDDEKSKSLGVDNAHLYEKKIVEWLKTPAGAKKAKEMSHLVENPPVNAPSPSFQPWTTSQTPRTPGPPGNPGGDISLSDWRANISTTETSFATIPVPEALGVQRAMEAKYGAITNTQISGLRYYTGSAYTQMNGFLRGFMDATDAVKKHIRDAQAGMRPSLKPMVFHRGTNPGQFGGAALDQDLVGKVMVDHGFMSTSVGGRAAFGGKVMLEIECPSGTPMSYVDHISKNQGENEMLLAAGTRYRVIAVEQENHRTIVKVRVIP
ncbi:MAG: hypothetical protein A2Y75_05415 [Candidatus Solincola sediminis]|uniref:NAD(+)--protein-arginine ADP-ribosyltransferase n=1 Tax=Candidatus Solincola sediminis TaxID=1797199 RepID=A0A1F2WG97_9ACTN|nr:MAG: hypothetical protein A2Y75_05415 [Candidatus Solincola sediminis]